MSELVAAADLIDKGWEVYRAMASDNSCDLIVVKGTIIRRLEVRTGAYGKVKGDIQFPRRDTDAARSDHYVVVVPRGGTLSPKVVYIPELPQLLGGE